MNYCENIEFPVICASFWIVCWFVGAAVIYICCLLLTMAGCYIAKLVFPGMKITELHSSMKTNISACESAISDLAEELVRLDLPMMTSLEDIRFYEARDIDCRRMTKFAARDLFKKNCEITHAKKAVERKLDDVIRQLTDMQQALGSMDDTLLEISQKLRSIHQSNREQLLEDEEQEQDQEQEQEQDQEQEQEQDQGPEEIQEAILIE